MKFSEKLKQLRVEKGLTQQELADRLYISRSAVAKWEQGRGYPSLEMLENLSGIFDLSIDDLLSEKEYHSMTIESNQKVKKHSRYYIAAMIVGGIFIIMFAILFGVYFKLKKNSVILYDYSLYGKLEIEESGIKFICVDDYSNFYFENEQTFIVTDKEKREIVVYNQYGKSTDINSLRTGYRVKVSFTSQQENRIENINIYRVDIIDDYVAGDYYAYGFFLSTEAVKYDQPPIYNDKNDEVLEWKGEEKSISMRYPYTKVYQDGTEYSSAGIFKEIDIEPLGYLQNRNDYCILKKLTYQVWVSKRVKKVYVYALDNTACGYSIVGEIDSPNIFSMKKIEIKNGGLFYRNSTDDVRYPSKIDAIFNIELVFYEDISKVEISEYNKNNECIYQSEFIRGEKFNTNYITKDDTRYVTIYCYTEEGKKTQLHYDWATRGDKIEIPVETYYGFVIKRTLKLY